MRHVVEMFNQEPNAMLALVMLKEMWVRQVGVYVTQSPDWPNRLPSVGLTLNVPMVPCKGVLTV